MSMLSRRRLFTIMAGCLARPALAQPSQEWRGRAMGAEALVRLSGRLPGSSYRLFREIERIISGVEQAFSLHTDSEIVRLNDEGLLRHPSQAMSGLLALCAEVHSATGGAFDPTIQPLWLALARGESGSAERRLIGWHRVLRDAEGIRLPPGFQLTLNGIAQGYCADQIASFLRQQGFGHVLVDTGELHAVGTPSGAAGWPVSVASADGAEIRQLSLANRALATSSPYGTRLPGGQSHILGPAGERPLWNTVSISADSAALADALSTAACLMQRAGIDRALSQFAGARLEAIV